MKFRFRNVQYIDEYFDHIIIGQMNEVQRVLKLKLMEVIFYAPPANHQYYIETTYENQIFKTVLFTLEDHKYLRLRKLNPFEIVLHHQPTEPAISIGLHPFVEGHKEKEIYWTKIEVNEMEKLKQGKMKYFSFPISHGGSLLGEMKIKVEASHRQADHRIQRCISRTAVSTYMKPILSKNEIKVRKEDWRYAVPRNSMEEVEEEGLLEKLQMINKIYEEKHNEGVWEEPEEEGKEGYAVIEEERQSEMTN